MPIQKETLAFLRENRLRDSRDWFRQNKEAYKALVEAPLLALSSDLGDTLRKIDPSITTEPRRTLSRIWRDTRFSKDKTTFREVMWLVFRRGKGMEYPAFYFEFSPEGYRYGCGYYAVPPRVMEKLRALVLADDARYLAAQRALEALEGFAIGGERFKRPRYPEEPPYKQEWLERKNLYITRNSDDMALLFSDSLAGVLSNAFLTLKPAYRFFLELHLEYLLEI